MTDNPRELLQQLDSAEQQQRWSQVEALCRQLLHQDPSQWTIWQRLALAHEARRDWTQAETLWRHLTQRFSNRSEPFLALAALQRKRDARAVTSLEPAKTETATTLDDPWSTPPLAPSLGPRASADAVAAMLQQAQVHLDAGRPADAEICLEQVLRARPQSTQLHGQLATLRLRRGAPAAVVEQLNPLLRSIGQLPPGEQRQQSSLALALLLAEALHLLQRWDELVALLQPLQGQHPDEPQLLWLLAEALLEQGRDLDALPLLQHCLRLEPARPLAQLALGELLQRRGDVGAAEAAFTRALAFDPLLERAASQLQQLRSSQAWQRGEAALANADWTSAAAAYRQLLDDPDLQPRARARLELLESINSVPWSREVGDPLHERLAAFHASLDQLEQRLQACSEDSDSRAKS
jgi:tetratricopeptide (TPR) repeat protein